MRTSPSLLLLTLAGCAGSQVILPKGQTPELQPHEGLWALGVETDISIRALTLVRVESQEEYGTGGFDEGRSLVLLRLPAGKYCLTDMRTNIIHFGFRASRRCFWIRPGETSYHGHVVFTRQDFGFEGKGAELDSPPRLTGHEADARGEIEAHYPGVLRRAPWKFYPPHEEPKRPPRVLID